jgi:NADH-quinone oxidoreductase subunit C
VLPSEVLQKINERFPGAAEEQPLAWPPGATKPIVIKKSSLLSVAGFLKNDLSFENLHCVSGVDRQDKKIEVVYHLYSLQNRVMITLKVVLERNDVTIETLSGFWKSANWLERETYDLFGVKFLNHPDLRRILNPDEWTYYPLRKDFDHPDFIRLPQSEGLKG